MKLSILALVAAAIVALSGADAHITEVSVTREC
jgi:hypothetical protein